MLLLHGPNLNLLGEREPEIYGTDSLDDYVAFTEWAASEHHLVVEAYQSNHEGELIEHIHHARGRCDAMIAKITKLVVVYIYIYHTTTV